MARDIVLTCDICVGDKRYTDEASAKAAGWEQSVRLNETGNPSWTDLLDICPSCADDKWGA